MTFKTIAVVASYLSLRLGIFTSLIGGATLAAQVAGDDVRRNRGCAEGSGAGISNVDPKLKRADCTTAHSAYFAELHCQAHNSCPNELTIRIGSFRLN